MGSWQPIGLTEGLWRVVAAPPPLAFSERSPPHGFATGRIGNGSSPPQNCVSLLRGKGLPRQCPAAAGPPCALPDFEEGERRAELAAQGHAIGARLAGQADEQLVRGRRKAKRRGRCVSTAPTRQIGRDHVSTRIT